MYNKLFTKILDSSIWLEPVTTRIAWLTFIAAMDENGFVGFASVANLARRANVTEEEAIEAVKILEAPDKNSSDPDFEGRRIERIEGGWMVLNAEKYRDLVTRETIKEKTRARVAEFRKKKKCNAHVTQCNVSVTPSEAYTISNTISDNTYTGHYSKEFEEFWNLYPKKIGKGGAWNSFRKLKVNKELILKIVCSLSSQIQCDQWKKDGGQFIPNPQTWLNQRRWEDEIVNLKTETKKPFNHSWDFKK